MSRPLLNAGRQTFSRANSNRRRTNAAARCPRWDDYSRFRPRARMRLCRLVRSTPRMRAAPDTFQFVCSRASTMRSRSAASRIPWKIDRCYRRWEANLHRSRIDRNAIPRREDGHSLDRVAKFSNISRPVVALQERHDVIGHRPGPEVVPRAELCEEIRRQLADVLASLSQRRHSNGYHAESIEQIDAVAVRKTHIQQIQIQVQAAQRRSAPPLRKSVAKAPPPRMDHSRMNGLPVG